MGEEYHTRGTSWIPALLVVVRIRSPFIMFINIAEYVFGQHYNLMDILNIKKKDYQLKSTKTAMSPD